LGVEFLSLVESGNWQADTDYAYNGTVHDNTIAVGIGFVTRVGALVVL
jgi:hypothetical protein